MTRSNAPQAQSGHLPPNNGPAEQDPQAWRSQPSPRSPRQINDLAAQQAYAQGGYAPQGEAARADPYAQNQGYRYPQAGQTEDPYGRPAAQQPRSAAAYVPAFDPYGAQQAPQAQPTAYGAPQGYADPRAAYDQWPAAAPARDQRGYDLGSYVAGGPSHSPGYDLGAQQQSAPAHGVWAGHDPYTAHAAEPSLDSAGYVHPHTQGGALEQPYAEEDGAYEVEEPRRRRGGKLIAALAGAVVVGGGLAYAYSLLLGPATSTSPPLVKSAEGPSKVKPSDPGGRQFAHTDSKIMGRLGEGTASGQATSPNESSDGSAPRKVPLLIVGRDGTIQPPPAAEPAVPAKATVAVPGMTVIDGLGAPPGKAAAAEPVAKPDEAAPKAAEASGPQEPVVVAPSAAPKKTEVIAKAVPAEPPATTQALADTAGEPAAPPAEKAAPPAKKLAVNAPLGPQPTGAGYVAVLASVPASSKSRIDALKQFADMQQKYGTLLQDKTPDVQEANLGEKGTYHRLLVGPPGSRGSASELCTQLKAQGYSNCWVTAY
ncbi:MAG TPA: SPOR domain-containing protein [Hyphomicrobiaceae bacterium]|nr:SPOR domain-containing protein [Hyphomicrobiaceae bacterium]